MAGQRLRAGGSPAACGERAESKYHRLIRNAGLTVKIKSTESAVEDGKETTFLWLIAEKTG